MKVVYDEYNSITYISKIIINFQLSMIKIKTFWLWPNLEMLIFVNYCIEESFVGCRVKTFVCAMM
jgi:uncharacterized membrane protein YoaT (DUF817 family)